MAIGIFTAVILAPQPVHAAEGDFALQVTPSPLVTTVRPGQATRLELKIRNAGTQTEQLKIEPRSFTLNNTSGEVKLNDTTPPDIADWIHFEHPTFAIEPGQWFTQHITVALPKDTGFSYSFALVISRQNEPNPTEGGRLIKGSLAVFTLVNVDRPGAKQQLGIVSLKASKGIYEYLPAELTLQLKNTGNTIVQPYGNVFIQRGSGDTSHPLGTLDVNKTKGYILPGAIRTLHIDWDDGFPAYKTVQNSHGKPTKQLEWDWAKVSKFRIGRYTAKVVAVYNNGRYDVPLQAQVSFWVIPWKILLGALIVALLVLFGLWSFVRKVIALFRRKKAKKAEPTEGE